MAQNTPVEMFRHASTISILWGVLLIVFGIVAVGMPLLAAVAVSALGLGLAALVVPVLAQGPLYDKVIVDLPYSVTIGNKSGCMALKWVISRNAAKCSVS